jgi:hypothetical protein
MAWAVAEFNRHPERDAIVAPGRSVPRWGWDGLQ